MVLRARDEVLGARAQLGQLASLLAEGVLRGLSQ